MHDIFDISRFGKYFAYQTRTGWKKYSTLLGATLVALMFMIVLAGLWAYEYEYTYSDYYRANCSGLADPMWAMEKGWFSFAVLFICINAAAFTFADLADKSGRIFALMIPASQFEKYLTRWIILGPLTLVLAVAGCELIDAIRCMVLSVRYPEADNIHLLGSRWFDWDHSEWKFIVGGFLLPQSVAVLGSSIWPKHSLVKTLLAVGVIAVANALFTFFMFENMIESGMRYDFGQKDIDVELTVENIYFYTCIGISVVNYVVAYFRYREIEIVQRW